MDSDYEYPLYKKCMEDSDCEEGENETCLHCSNYPIQEKKIQCVRIHNTPNVSFEQALRGHMVPYVQVFEDNVPCPFVNRKLFVESKTTLRYVDNGSIVSLRGAIHMQDVSPNGVWLAEKSECKNSVSRLRLAGLICLHLPELNRVVLEQKNDDGLLYLANTWLCSQTSMTQGMDIFGPFACDAVLAPVLHKILRSGWIEEHKEQKESNNQLKLGWAQEFYDWKCVVKDKTGSLVFSHDLTCAVNPESTHCYKHTTHILDKMRWCGYTPWSAVQSVRCVEGLILELECNECKKRLLANCVFLVECAAVEASRQHDWLVRNEAVIQVCWLLYHIHKPYAGNIEGLLGAWSESIMLHSIRFQEYTMNNLLSEVEPLVAIYGIDHLPFSSKKPNDTTIKLIHEDNGPPPELLRVIERNEQFAPKRRPVVCSSGSEDDPNTSLTVHVWTKAPNAIEARAQRVNVIAQALVLCFPRVAASALEDLTLKAPNTGKCSARLWPVFVNTTRACYPLFGALALPVSPSPEYTLELLARGWRCIPQESLERFTPMSSGGSVKVSHKHYTKHFIGPISTLVNLRLVRDSEYNLMIEALTKGVLPCFAVEGDSMPDRLVSSTVALTFAACGLRVFGLNTSRGGSSHLTVTFAGVLYFAAWYLLVYMATLHLQPTLKKILSRTGSDADRHLCAALKLKRLKGGVNDYRVTEYNGEEIMQALRILFGNLLDMGTIIHIAELYVPELLVQLPYAKKLGWIPDSVKSAIESRDIWFAREHGEKTGIAHCEPPFVYLGNLAQGLHSSIEGTLTMGYARPIAQALRRPENVIAPWCESQMVQGLEDDRDRFEDVLRLDIQDEQHETYFDLDKAEHVSGESVTSTNARFHPTEVCSYPDPEPERSQCEGLAVHEKPQLDNGQIDCLRICKGLLVADVYKLGFVKGHKFLAQVHTKLTFDHKRRDPAPTMKHPCMTNIASTVYAKAVEEIDVTRCQIAHRTLIEALWVLFMHSQAKCSQPSAATTAPVGKCEPSTPEALSVMVHLAVKSFKGAIDSNTVSTLSICNDMTRIHFKSCDLESEFLPIVAIVAGMFQLNVELNVHGCKYYIMNKHYNGNWAPGSICYNRGMWYVMIKGLENPVQIPQETPTVNCYHRGTLASYIRLNDLKVSRVASDNYCGFHTVAVLLGIIGGSDIDQCNYDVRRDLVHTTAEYMIQHRDSEGICVYLGMGNICNVEELKALFMQQDRWLSTEEIVFILNAHGKRSVGTITENTYPIYNPKCTYFLIKSNHYEPVMHI